MTFPSLSTTRTLTSVAAVLGCSADDLKEIASASDQRFFYQRIRIPKKNTRRRGRFRTVYKANQRLAIIHKNLPTWLSEHVSFPECVQGFVQRRSIVSNATVHLNQPRLLHADIKGFFDSIHIDQVMPEFLALGASPDVADVLAKVCTLNGRLPQGSSVSPLLANLVCKDLDSDFRRLADANGCRYSRYADDITISGTALPGSAAVESILAKHHFVLRDGRCRTQRRGRSQYVTGLTVFDSSRPRVPRSMKRRVRLEVHYALKYGLEEHLKHIGSSEDPLHALARLSGWMSFIYSVESEAQRALYLKWRQAEENYNGGGFSFD